MLLIMQQRENLGEAGGVGNANDRGFARTIFFPLFLAQQHNQQSHQWSRVNKRKNVNNRLIRQTWG